VGIWKGPFIAEKKRKEGRKLPLSNGYTLLLRGEGGGKEKLLATKGGVTIPDFLPLIKREK